MPRANIPASDASFQPTTASWRIEVSNSALPLIEAPVVIDGYTQPGASANTLTPREGGLSTLLKIELSLSNGNGFSGLEIQASFPVQGASTIRGLAISRFINQIVLTGTAAHRIERCFLGTDISGTQPASTPAQGRGMFGIGNGSCVIGGSTPAARITGNYFGVGANGLTPLGNGLNSGSPSQPLPTISVFAGSDCRTDIGGEALGEASLIAHGGAAGIQVSACNGLSAPFNRYW